MSSAAAPQESTDYSVTTRQLVTFYVVAVLGLWATYTVVQRLDLGAAGSTLLIATLGMWSPTAGVIVALGPYRTWQLIADAFRQLGAHALRILGALAIFVVSLPLAVWTLTALGSVFVPDLTGHLVADKSAMAQALKDVPNPQEALAAMPNNPWVIVPFALISAVLAGLTINGFAALGEELGWRGFLMPALAERGITGWRNDVVVGTLWGAWHLPLLATGFNYPSLGLWGVVPMIGFTIALSRLLRISMAGSVLAAAALHGALNALDGVYSITMLGGQDGVRSIVGVLGWVAILLVSIPLARWWAGHDAAEELHGEG